MSTPNEPGKQHKKYKEKISLFGFPKHDTERERERRASWIAQVP